MITKERRAELRMDAAEWQRPGISTEEACIAFDLPVAELLAMLDVIDAAEAVARADPADRDQVYTARRALIDALG